MPLLEAYARAHPELAVVGIALDDPDVARDFAANVGVSNILTVEVVPTCEGLRPDTHDQDPQLAEQPPEQLEPGQRPR